jgi:hypothetical protein
VFSFEAVGVGHPTEEWFVGASEEVVQFCLRNSGEPLLQRTIMVQVEIYGP